MSSFTELCGKGKSGQYLMIVNELDECGIAILDENGKPIDWCFGNIVETLQSILREKYKNAKVNINEFRSVYEASFSRVDFVKDLVRLMNAKTSDLGVRDRENKAVIEICWELDRLNNFVTYNSDNKAIAIVNEKEKTK